MYPFLQVLRSNVDITRNTHLVLFLVLVPKPCKPLDLLGSAEIKQTTEGFKGAMKTFDNTRPLVAAMAIGIARAAIDFTREKMEENGISLDYSKNTNNISALEKEFYTMEAHLDAMRLLTWRAAWMADNEQFNNLEASMSKAKAGRYATLITQKCCELLGPLGFSRNYLAEMHTVRHLRAGEVLVTRLAERRDWHTWDQAGREEMAGRAQAQAERLLAEHTVPPLSHEQDRELDEIMNAAERELAAD